MARRVVTPPLRGQVFMVPIAGSKKPALVVSNNHRNRRLESVLAVRITTAPKPALETIVELPPGEPVKGRVLCDDLAPVPKGMLGRSLGGLSPGVMRRVDRALRVALALE